MFVIFIFFKFFFVISCQLCSLYSSPLKTSSSSLLAIPSESFYICFLKMSSLNLYSLFFYFFIFMSQLINAFRTCHTKQAGSFWAWNQFNKVVCFLVSKFVCLLFMYLFVCLSFVWLFVSLFILFVCLGVCLFVSSLVCLIDLQFFFVLTEVSILYQKYTLKIYKY